MKTHEKKITRRKNRKKITDEKNRSRLHCIILLQYQLIANPNKHITLDQKKQTLVLNLRGVNIVIAYRKIKAKHMYCIHTGCLMAKST